MSRSEGGIPYRTQRQKLTVHATIPFSKASNKTVCQTTAGRYQSTSNPEHVTCRDCKEQA